MICIHAEAALDKIQHPCIRKTDENRHLNLIKAIYDKRTPNIILYGENLRVFPLKTGITKRLSIPTNGLLPNIILKTLARKSDKRKT